MNQGRRYSGLLVLPSGGFGGCPAGWGWPNRCGPGGDWPA